MLFDCEAACFRTKAAIYAAERRFFMTKEKKAFVKDLLVLWLALSALVCAALNMHVSLNMLGNSAKRE